MLSAVYSKTAEQNEMVIGNSIIALTGILAGDNKLYKFASKSKGGKQKMCNALQESYNKIRNEANIVAVMNMLKLGNAEDDIRKFYPDQFDAGKKLFEQEKTNPPA